MSTRHRERGWFQRPDDVLAAQRGRAGKRVAWQTRLSTIRADELFECAAPSYSHFLSPDFRGRRFGLSGRVDAVSVFLFWAHELLVGCCSRGVDGRSDYRQRMV